MTGNQLERFARAHRQVTSADDAAARIRRRLTWRFEEDGSLAGTFRLPPLAGAVLLKALRAAAGDLEHPHGDAGVSAETAAGEGPVASGGQQPTVTSSSLADALLAVAEAFLAGQVAAADNPDVYQVIVHVGTGAAAAMPRSGRRRRRAARRDASRRFRGNAGWPSAGAGPPGRPGPVPPGRRARDQRQHRADARLRRDPELDAARPRRHPPGRRPPTQEADRRASPGCPGTRPLPVPVPRL